MDTRPDPEPPPAPCQMEDMPSLLKHPNLDDSDNNSTVNERQCDMYMDSGPTNDNSAAENHLSWVFTADSDPSEPMDPMYTYNRWDYRYDHPFYELDDALMRYDLPLGLGLNDHLEPSTNLLFTDMEPQGHRLQTDHFPTTVLQAVRPQLGNEKSPVQFDTGANISITPVQTVMQQYRAIAPFRVSHAGTGGPPLMAVGAGLYELHGDDGDTMEVCMFYCPMASGTIVSPDHVCASVTNT